MSLRSLLLLTLLAVVGCRKGLDGVDGTVVILVLDGVRVEESLGDDQSSATGEHPQEFMPQTWSELLPQGVRASAGWSLGATTTTPAHAAIVGGRRLPLANYPMNGEVGLYQPELPTLVQAARDQLEADEEQVVVIANTELIHPVQLSLWPDSEPAGWVWVHESGNEDKPAADDRAVLDALKTHMSEHPTRLALLNLHQVDRSGHYGATNSYLEDVRDLDEPVVRLWSWLQEQVDYREDTYLWVLSDHGRHSYSQDDPTWRHHGCNCNGCRRIPSLLLGPGVAAGQDFDQPSLLADVAPTLAATMGLELPWARGLVLDGLLDQPSGVSSREGVADFAVSKGLLAEVRFLDDPARRSELWIEGSRLSDPAALEVEAPAILSEGDEAWLCFREVLLTPDEADTSWTASCWSSEDAGSSWQAMEAPVSVVGPHWRPVLLAEPDGALLMAYVRNLNAASGGGVEGGEGEVSLALARWEDGAWTATTHEGDQTWPQDLVAIQDDAGALFLAVGASTSDNEARHHRDVYTARVALAEDAPDWLGIQAAQLSSLSGDSGQWRLELPAIRVDDDGVLHLAAVAHSEAGGHAVLAASSDGGESYGEATIVSLPAPVDPHVAPTWLGERAVWVTVSEQDAQICAATTAGEVSCSAAGGARVERLQADGETLWALVDVGVAAWELSSFGADAL